MQHSMPLQHMVETLRQRVGDTPDRWHHRGIVATLGNLADTVKSLEDLARSRSPLETEGAHAHRIHQAAQKLEAAALEAQKRIGASVSAGYAELSTAIDSKAGLVENQDASEIRATIRAMPDKRRMEVLREAVQNNDPPVVAAIGLAHPLLTGLNDDFRQKMVEAFRETHAPEEYKARKELDELFNTSLTFLDTVRGAAKAATDPDYIAGILKADEHARNAQAAFNSSVNA